MDYAEDIVLMGSDGLWHIKIEEGKIKVRLTGISRKSGNGLSIEL